MKIGSSLHSLSSLSYRTNNPLLQDAGDDGAQSSGRQTPGDATLTGMATVPAPALSQALWDMTADSAPAPYLSEDAARANASRDDLSADLHKWANMSVAEKIRAQYLERKGLSESDLAAMPAEDRQAIENEIREAVKQALGIKDETSGGDPDTAAAKPA